MATPDTLLAEARQALSHNRIADAKALIKRALGRAPQCIDLLVARAHVEHASGDNVGAAETCRVVLTRDPRNVPALNALGEALRGHDNEGAEAAWRRALELDPRNAETLFHLGNLLGERNEADAAVAAYEKALQIAPGTPSLLINLGLQLERSGKSNEAERCYRDVLVHRTTQIEALANLADLLFRQRRFVEALEQYDRLVERVPGVPAEVWNNRGVCQKYTWNNSGAIQSFQRALELEPDAPQVLANLGFAEYERGRYEVSRLLLKKAHKLDPTRLQIRAHLLDLDLQFADWNDFGRQRDELVDAVAAISDRQHQTVAPFAFMSICDLPDLQLAAAKSFAWPEEPRDTAYERCLMADTPGVPRLRLGFVSTVFHEHLVPRLIIDLLERLDRRKFEIYAYALGAGIADAMRARLASLASAFREVAGRSASDIAAQIRADRIEILSISPAIPSTHAQTSLQRDPRRCRSTTSVKRARWVQNTTITSGPIPTRRRRESKRTSRNGSGILVIVTFPATRCVRSPSRFLRAKNMGLQLTHWSSSPKRQRSSWCRPCSTHGCDF